MPIIEHAPSLASANPSNSLHAAFFKAAGIPDAHAEISFKAGCVSMGFHNRQQFKIALKYQKATDALGESVAGVRLPEPHWKDGRQWFYLGEVEAYTAATQGE